MTHARKPPLAAATDGKERSGEVVAASEFSPSATDFEIARRMLRQRWELASVLNFLHVFEPVIESGLKISAEEIEMALIEQNSTLAELHIALLKGILPSSKTLKGQDAWMVAVYKTLAMWWPWVGQGNFPLTGAKGEEICVYKDLEPTNRLLVLKALCEVRVDQYDAVSYINDAMKNGSEVSKFRKDKLAGDGNRISVWCDGNETMGYRLYKEVNHFENARVNDKFSRPAISCEWETLATNLEEFKNIVIEFSSGGSDLETAVSNSISADIIPILEKQQKKKLRALHRQERERVLLNGFRNSGITRSCRNSKHVDYKFDDYDRSIKEAIQYANKRKTNEENQGKCRKRMEAMSNGSNNSDTAWDEESAESDAERNNHQGSSDTDQSSDDEYDAEKDDSEPAANSDMGKVYFPEKQKVFANRPRGMRFSRRLAGVPGHTTPESLNLGLKNRLRQRPNINTAIESLVVSDSEDETLSEEQ